MNVWIVIPTYNETANLELMVEAVLDQLDWTAPSPNGSDAGPAPDSPAAAAQDSPTGPAPDSPRAPLPSRPNVSPLAKPRPAPDVSILVVDDNSPDGTGLLADRISAEREGQVAVLHRVGKMGLGSAYLAGFAFALQRGADVIFEMDADFSHDPAYLPRMVARLEQGYDVVVGSRWAEGGRLDEAWEPWRYYLSKYANLYARWVTGLNVCDTTAGFKAWRADALRKLPLHRVRSDGYAFQIEMAMASQRNGLRVAELPIYFVERARGASKMSLRIIAEAAWRVWQIRTRW